MTKIDRSLIVCFSIPPLISALNNITSKSKSSIPQVKKVSVVKMTENSSLSSSWNCLGTRMVVVVGDNSASSDVSSNEAMLIVHNENFPSVEIEDGGSLSKSIKTTTATTKKKSPPLYSSRLKLVLCTGRGSKSNHQIYSHIINVSDEKQVKLRSNDDRSKLGDYFLQDDRYHPNIIIEFHYLSITKIKVDIKQKISTVNNHVMKNVYNGNLEVESDLSMLEFCNTYLGRPLNSAKSEIQELTKSLTKSEKAVNQWKDTAEKLDKDVWSKEKDRLLDGFLKLWNEYKSKAQIEIQHLKDELEKAKNAAAKTTTTPSSKKRQLAFDNNDAPDDLDNELPIPMDVAERYAKGGGSGRGSNNNNNANTKKKKRNPILKPNDTFSASDLKRGQEEKKRKDAIEKQQREEAKAAKAAAAAAAAAQEAQEQEEAQSPDCKENTRPAKIARKNNKKKQHDRNTTTTTTTAPTPDSDEDSDDIRLRMAIRANVKRSTTGDDGDDDGFDSDLSY